jgi:hypothetical protein
VIPDIRYQHDPAVLSAYISMPPGGRPGGRFIDFEEGFQDAFQPYPMGPMKGIYPTMDINP